MFGFHSRQQDGFTVRGLILIFGTVILLLALVFPIFHRMNIKALQAEAQLTLTYIASVESLYRIDKGKYVVYGAQLMGRERCGIPKGAEELGFVLKSCAKDPRNGGIRYAYKVLPNANGDNFQAIAESGSDVTGESFICIGTNRVDIWQSGPEKNLQNTHFCE